MRDETKTSRFWISVSPAKGSGSCTTSENVDCQMFNRSFEVSRIRAMFPLSGMSLALPKSALSAPNAELRWEALTTASMVHPRRLAA